MMAYATRFNTFFVLSVEKLLYCTVQKKKATFKHTPKTTTMAGAILVSF